jgi:alanine racemase
LNLNSQFSPREAALREGLRVWAEVDLDLVAANVRALIAQAGDARLLTVVKGNAYGHGAVPVARAALEAGAWGLGVIDLAEGEELRRAGITAPILVLGSSPPSLAHRLVAADLRVTLGSVEMAAALVAARIVGRPAIVHLKVETGLNRFGLLPDEAVALAEELRETPGIVIEGLSTHLASVDEGDKTFTFEQYKLFRACADRLPWIPMHHISSTGAVLDLPELRLALVRSGIGVYGYYPSDEVSHGVRLDPVLSLRSRIARVATLDAGQSVGYGRTWTAPDRRRVGLVMAGYADGLRRALSNQGVGLVRGQRVPFIGRVAMDMHMVDLEGVPDAAVDDEVTLIGQQGDEQITADEVAGLTGTISYEVLAGLMARVPRLYIRDGRLAYWWDLSGYHEV